MRGRGRRGCGAVGPAGAEELAGGPVPRHPLAASAPAMCVPPSPPLRLPFLPQLVLPLTHCLSLSLSSPAGLWDQPTLVTRHSSQRHTHDALLPSWARVAPTRSPSSIAPQFFLACRRAGVERAGPGGVRRPRGPGGQLSGFHGAPFCAGQQPAPGPLRTRRNPPQPLPGSTRALGWWGGGRDQRGTRCWLWGAQGRWDGGHRAGVPGSEGGAQSCHPRVCCAGSRGRGRALLPGAHTPATLVQFFHGSRVVSAAALQRLKT